MDILIEFLMMVAASFIGILLAAATVDKFRSWKNKRR